jgi:hypothetical protein
VAAVAVAPRPRHAVAAVPRPAVAAPDPEGERRQRPCVAVSRPVAATPLPRRAVAEVPRSAAGPLCGQAAASPKPRGGGTSKAGEQATPVDVRVATATPVDVRVATATHEADVRASDVTEGARCAQR